MKTCDKWVIYGGSLASLVLAEKLGSSGKQVTLINPSTSWGGLFSGINIEGYLFDAGMTNFEFELFGEPDPDIENYSPDRKSDIQKYVHYVKEYVESFLEVHAISSPLMTFRGGVLKDLIISNNFEVLKKLSKEEINGIRAELEVIVSASKDLHPKFKYQENSRLNNSSFEKASRANHGLILHNLFVEPFFGKVLDIKTSEILAPYHRNGWSPLFYPETLLNALNGSLQPIKETIFHYPLNAKFGSFIAKLVSKVKKLKTVEVLEGARLFELCHKDKVIKTEGRAFAYNKIAWGADINSLYKQLKPDYISTARKRASVDIFFMRVEESGVGLPYSVLLDPESDSPFYRVTNQTVCAAEKASMHDITLEVNSQNILELDEESNIFKSSLAKYKISEDAIKYLKKYSFSNALAIPCKDAESEFMFIRSEIENSFAGLHLIGPSSGYVSVTFNDQVIQALRLARKEAV
jgi:hypothetical protein